MECCCHNIRFILWKSTFWARTESGIFRAVLRADPNFDDAPWPSASPEAKDFVKRLLNKDLRKRMTAAQALTHPWLRGQHVFH
jgi:serine/threonine protein kinase